MSSRRGSPPSADKRARDDDSDALSMSIRVLVPRGTAAAMLARAAVYATYYGTVGEYDATPPSQIDDDSDDSDDDSVDSHDSWECVESAWAIKGELDAHWDLVCAAVRAVDAPTQIKCHPFNYARVARAIDDAKLKRRLATRYGKDETTGDYGQVVDFEYGGKSIFRYSVRLRYDGQSDDARLIRAIAAWRFHTQTHVTIEVFK